MQLFIRRISNEKFPKLKINHKKIAYENKQMLKSAENQLNRDSFAKLYKTQLLRSFFTMNSSTQSRKIVAAATLALSAVARLAAGSSIASVLASATLVAAPVQAVSIVRINRTAFTPSAGKITFSEFANGTVNPFYTPANYGGLLTGTNVSFDGFFLGQALSGTPAVDCPGGAASGCVVGTPSSLLALNPTSSNTFITGDGANPTSPVLSGSPTFNGPISILFSQDLAGVGLDGGFFDAPESTAIKAFARDGSFLGQVKNTGLGIEFLGLVTNDGTAAIAGLQFSLIGPEPAGFAIDNVQFGLPGQVDVPNGIAVPGPLPILGAAAAYSQSRRLRRRIQLSKQA